MKKPVLAPLATAEKEVAAAEESLADLLKALRVQPRPEKVTITKTLETAFKRLRVARANLAKARALVDAD